MADPPQDVRRLADARSEARAAKDFARADEIRDQLAAAGWGIVDRADGSFEIVSIELQRAAALSRPADVESVLDEPATFDVSLHWVCEGWPDDIDRAIRGFRRHSGGRSLQFVVAVVTGEAPDRWGEDVEVVRLVEDAGWAAARNAGLRRTRADVLMALDPSIEPTGDVIGPLTAALGEPGVGIAGPFGIVTTDLREFHESSGPGPVDAIEAYLMAFPRDVFREVGGFDEGFRWYRSADIEWSFRVKDAGYRVEMVNVPVTKHEHRMWEATSPDDRARLSKRNFNRFLDRYRDRWDLVVAGSPESR